MLFFSFFRFLIFFRAPSRLNPARGCVCPRTWVVSPSQGVVVLVQAIHDGLPAGVDVVELRGLLGKLLADILSQENVLDGEGKPETETETERAN